MWQLCQQVHEETQASEVRAGRVGGFAAPRATQVEIACCDARAK
jgi:hypothetical protein